MENKIIQHIGEGNFDSSQARTRDNIYLQLKNNVQLIPDEESAISELDEAVIDDDVDFHMAKIESRSLSHSLRDFSEPRSRSRYETPRMSLKLNQKKRLEGLS